MYEEIEEKSDRLEKGLKNAADAAGVSVCINRVASMLCVFFTEESVVDFKTAYTSDTERFGRYFLSMLKQGIYLAPSQFETVFVSNAHSIDDIDRTTEAAYRAFLETK